MSMDEESSLLAEARTQGFSDGYHGQLENPNRYTGEGCKLQYTQAYAEGWAKREDEKNVPALKKLHPSFQKIFDVAGSGFYFFDSRVGFGGIFYMSSKDVTVYNAEPDRDDEGHRRSYHDYYDALRAVERGYVRKLTLGDGFCRGQKGYAMEDFL